MHKATQHPLPKRIIVTDFARSIDPIAQANALKRGDGFIFRHYELRDRERQALGRTLRETCRRKQALFLVAGDAKLGVSLRADGLHLPRWCLNMGKNWRATVKANWILSAAVHNQAEIIAAERAHVDLCILSPILPTFSHVGAKSLGPIGAAKLIRVTSLPVYAMGGINRATQQRIRHVGVAGFAGTDPDQ